MKKLFCLLLVCYNLAALAENTHDCVYLEVNLLNQYEESCQLIDKSIAHGRLSDDSEIPLTIPSEQAKRFYVRQTHFGPDVILSYQCGAYTFKIESQQNLCLFSAGSISTSILENDGLKLSAREKQGSSWSGHPGEVHWTISAK